MHILQEIVGDLYANSPTTTLFHYTSLNSMLGIVRSKVLWTSEIRYLNASQEILCFANRISVEVMRRLERSDENRDLLSQLRDWVLDRFRSGSMVFVGCFTQNGNLLSQWRGYCPPGKGVSLGFDPQGLTLSVKQSNFSIGRCIYDRQQQERIASQTVDGIVALAQGYIPVENYPLSQSYYDLFQTVEPVLLRIAALIKDISFHEEDEWRVVSP